MPEEESFEEFHRRMVRSVGRDPDETYDDLSGETRLRYTVGDDGDVVDQKLREIAYPEEEGDFRQLPPSPRIQQYKGKQK